MLEVDKDKNLYPKFHFCILNWNGGDLLDECLESVFRNKANNYKVTVIDNNSSNFCSTSLLCNIYTKTHKYCFIYR